MKKENTIELVKPKPYEKVGARFTLSGWVPKSWLDSGFGLDYRVFLDFLDIDGQTFIGSSADVKINWLSKFRKKLQFSTVVQFNQFNASFIAKSQGRITIKLSGHKENHSYFLPLIIEGFEPENGVSPEIVEKHKNIGKRIIQYENDLKNYNKELEVIRNKTQRKISGNQKDDLRVGLEIRDEEISKEISHTVESSKDFEIEILNRAEKERLERKLEEKYKDALKWRGPLLGGIDLLPHILETCVAFFTLWVLRHTFQDIDDALWGKFNKLVQGAFVSVKKKIANGKKDIAIVVKSGNNQKAIVFLFSNALSLDEADDALLKTKGVLTGLNKEILGKEVYMPLVYKFNSSSKQWEETKENKNP